MNGIWPSYPPTLGFVKQLIRQETAIFTDPVWAADFLADQSIFSRSGGLFSSGLELAMVHDRVHRYQGEQVDGIQN